MDKELHSGNENHFDAEVRVENSPNDQKYSQDIIEIMNEEISSRQGRPKEWALSDFQIGKPLGRGQFGCVYLAREKKTSLIVSLKTLVKDQVAGPNRIQLMREIKIQADLDHTNILSLYGHFHDENKIYIILEYAEGGDVFTKLYEQPEQRFCDRRSAKYVYQTADALEYCHSKQIIHRDIKPENLLLDSADNIKLADFGWSVYAPSKNLKKRCGTLDYMPPEMVQSKCYDNRVDHWCLGVALYEFLVGKAPFTGSNKKLIFKKIRQVQVEYPPHLDPRSIDLISKLLKLNSDERISLQEVKSHPWIVENHN